MTRMEHLPMRIAFFLLIHLQLLQVELLASHQTPRILNLLLVLVKVPSVVTGVLFLLTTFLAPLVAIIPYEAATPALIIVGFLMMTQIKSIDWEDYGIAIPAFLTIILMPFTYNISVGIGAGFVSYVVIRLLQGRSKDIHPLLLLVAGLFMIYFLNNPINTWVS